MAESQNLTVETWPDAVIFEQHAQVISIENTAQIVNSLWDSLSRNGLLCNFATPRPPHW